MTVPGRKFYFKEGLGDFLKFCGTSVLTFTMNTSLTVCRFQVGQSYFLVPLTLWDLQKSNLVSKK